VRFIEITTLNDAESFLNGSRGLPSIISARGRVLVYNRAVVILSWISVEEIVRNEGQKLFPKPPSRSLWDAIRAILATKINPPSAKQAEAMRLEFLAQRRLRNRIVHPADQEYDVTLDEAATCFGYCKSLINSLSALPVITRASEL
jgi:hypothetical protein